MGGMWISTGLAAQLLETSRPTLVGMLEDPDCEIRWRRIREGGHRQVYRPDVEALAAEMLEKPQQ